MFCGKEKEQTKSHRQRRREEPSLKINSSKRVAVVLFRSVFLNLPPPSSLSQFSLCLSLWHPAGNITPHSTQMGSPRTSHASVQSCMQIYKRNSMIMGALNLWTRTHSHALPSNPGHQLRRENQVISISLIALYHISTCSPPLTRPVLLPHKTYTYRPHHNNPAPSPLTPL